MFRLTHTGVRGRAWWAIAVFCLSALMPTLTAWVASGRAQAAPWLELCSAKAGTTLLAVADDEPGSSRSSGHPLSAGHCPFCVLQDHAPMLPATASLMVVAQLPSAEMVPTRFLRAPRTPHVWSPAAARAPPASV